MATLFPTGLKQLADSRVQAEAATRAVPETLVSGPKSAAVTLNSRSGP